jgi:DNA-directed RNA polymerase subunit N (RpoN/RPB10)
MIIPIKCVSCGMVLADKYRYYISKVREAKLKNGMDTQKVIYFSKDMANENVRTPEAIVLDELELKNVCCRRVMLTHVDID